MFAIVGLIGAGAGAGAGAVARVIAGRKNRHPSDGASTGLTEELSQTKQSLRRTEKALCETKKRADEFQNKAIELKANIR